MEWLIALAKLIASYRRASSGSPVNKAFGVEWLLSAIRTEEHKRRLVMCYYPNGMFRAELSRRWRRVSGKIKLESAKDISRRESAQACSNLVLF